ncbi:MAG: urease subunit beta [Neisseriales bacterium]|nr:MAG: urease subunit beta [Neisseriales bacterium]HRG61945.1 urease subunit beta [Burkholderiales bacterium]
MIPGEIIPANKAAIELNTPNNSLKLKVANLGDRPIQVGSHFHFFEVNKKLSFIRELAYGMRLDIPSGTALRFEPGEERTIVLTHFGGNKIVCGFNALVNGDLDQNKLAALASLSEQQFLSSAGE